MIFVIDEKIEGITVFFPDKYSFHLIKNFCFH